MRMLLLGLILFFLLSQSNNHTADKNAETMKGSQDMVKYIFDHRGSICTESNFTAMAIASGMSP